MCSCQAAAVVHCGSRLHARDITCVHAVYKQRIITANGNCVWYCGHVTLCGGPGICGVQTVSEATPPCMNPSWIYKVLTMLTCGSESMHCASSALEGRAVTVVAARCEASASYVLAMQASCAGHPCNIAAG